MISKGMNIGQMVITVITVKQLKKVIVVLQSLRKKNQKASLIHWALKNLTKRAAILSALIKTSKLPQHISPLALPAI